MLGGVLIIIGLLILMWSTPVGWVATFVGCALFGFTTQSVLRRLNRGRRQAMHRLRLNPAIHRVSVIDRLAATATLDSTTYSVSRPDIGGRITIDAEWGDSAHERVRSYIENRARKQRDQVPFDAGSVVLRGKIGLHLTELSGCRELRPGVLLLTGRVGDHEMLRSEDGVGRRAWNISADYDIVTAPGKELVVPIWLTPTLVPRSDRRALDLEIQWTEFGPRKGGMPLLSIDFLRVDVVSTWGKVLDTHPMDARIAVTRNADGSRSRALEWRNIEIVDPTARGRQRISVSLENRIGENDILTGTLEARFDGTLSQVEGLDLFRNSGERSRDRPSRRRYTRIALDFSLSLESLRYEDLRILPAPPTDEAADADPEAGDRRESDWHGELHPALASYPGVIPNARTVAALTASLGEDGNYVKRVVENPGRPGRQPSTVLRFWDIAGRMYDRVHPIDFHLIITGSEQHEGHSPVDGRTDVSLTVRGAYWSDDSDRTVTRVWNNLNARIDSTLRSLEVTDSIDAPSWDPGENRRSESPQDDDVRAADQSRTGTIVPVQRWGGATRRSAR